MINQDFDAFLHAWNTALSVYGEKAEVAVVKLVFNLLSQYSLAEVKAALAAHLSDPDAGMFPPKPANLIRHLQGTSAGRSHYAWTQVYKAIRSIGSHASVQFVDGLIMRVIEDMGGWIALNKISNDELPFKERDFITRYQAYLVTPPLDPIPTHLPGIIECKNQKEYPDMIPAPVLIGVQREGLTHERRP